MGVLISPAEPRVVYEALHRALPAVISSSLPEQRGVDFLWRARDHWWGVQRKELADLMSSMADGRLSKEIGQMSEVAEPKLIIERHPRWTTDGELTDSWGQRFTRTQWVGMLASLQHLGVGVIQTASITETVEAVVALVKWSKQPSHTSLLRRPTPSGSWGSATSREWGLHLLQGFPGVGAGVAGTIFDHFGRVPLQWTTTRDELETIQGIGPKRAEQLMDALRDETNGT